MDLSINKLATDFLKQLFQLTMWYTYIAMKYIYRKRNLMLLNLFLLLSTMKPLCVKWLIDFCNYMLAHPEMAQNGFKAARIIHQDSKSRMYLQIGLFKYRYILCHIIPYSINF